MNLHSRELAIEELTIGAPLAHDIIDPEGRVLLRQGHILLQHVVERWISKGFTKVLVAEEASAPAAVETESSLTRDYDASLVAQVQQVMNRVQAALNEMLFDIAVKSEPRLGLFDTVTESLALAIEADSDVVAAQANLQIGQLSTGNEALLRRSAALSTLATATAVHLGMPPSDCLTVAMAGILHDISMYEETRAMVLGDRSSDNERREFLLRHSQLSADLLSGCRDVSEHIRVVITQVHEQVDGSGFPRGIGGHLMSVHSRVLNLVDAYLTLTDPNLPRAFVPADALAYLTAQTTRGAFDLDCMRALLKTLSIYSIGSRVVLDDKSTAVVLRSSRSDPMRPVVRLDGTQARIIDLRTSKNYILGPVVDSELPARQRLQRTELNNVLWKPQI